MSTAAAPHSGPADKTKSSANPLEKHHFLLRRLHSLTGIMPVGVFVIFHLFTNMQMMFGTFQHEVEFIHSLPALLFLEIFGLWLPIAFHAGLGVVYMLQGKSNSQTYKYGDNLRYSLQRWSAWIALIFIFYHVATLRWGWTFFGLVETPFLYAPDAAQAIFGVDSYPLSFSSTAYAMQHGVLNGWLTTAFYIVGVAAVVYHWSNGLWTAAITWGVTVTKAAQRRWGYVCAAMGVALAIFSAAAIYAARTYPMGEDVRHNVQLYIDVMRGRISEQEAQGQYREIPAERIGMVHEVENGDH